jgi:hypothetical protein
MMPSVSKKQHNFMAAVAKNPSFAKKVGIKPSVGEEFLKADKGRKFKEGGEMKESKAMMQKEVAFMKKKGAPKSMLKHEMAEAKGMKKGGMACSPASMKKTAGLEATKVVNKHEKKMHGMARGGGIEIKGKTKGKMIKMKDGGAC